MAKYIDILGASPAALSMILESLYNVINLENAPSVRIIKNLDNKLDYPFEIENLHVEIIQVEEVSQLAPEIVFGVNMTKTKISVYDFFKNRYNISSANFINLIHPKAALANTVKLGRGVHINPLTTIAPYAEIGDFVSINRNSSIGHHTRVGEFSTINPSVHIAGHCHIAENVTLGIGAVVLDAKKIGKNSMIAAGSLVTKDVPENVLVMGSPAKIVRTF